MTHSTGDERLLRIDDVAEMANVSRDTVHRWIKAGYLTPAGRTPVTPEAAAAGRTGSPRFTRASVVELLRAPVRHDDPDRPTLTDELLGKPAVRHGGLYE